MPDLKKKILFIEDDPILLKAVSAALEKEGFEVLTATDGETGIKSIEEANPNLVILDIILPKKNGYEIMEYVKLKPELAGIPIVILTNLEGSQDVERMLALGARAFLVKANYTIDEIVKAIKRILETIQ
ncbi:MAG: response regulator [Patescibacteria group bacterium]